MKPIIITTIFVCVTVFVFGQLPAIPLTRPAIKAVYTIEQSNQGKISTYNGITFRVASGYFPNSDSFHLGQPIMSIRETAPLKTILNYYYSLPDSTVRLVEYTWNAAEEQARELNAVFEANRKHFFKLFKQEGNQKEEKHDTWSQKTLIWQNSHTYVEQFMVTGAGTNRVRVLVSWK